MSTPAPISNEPLLQEPPDFSLVLGGPLFQLWRRAGLRGDALKLLHRRIVVMTLLAWVPLLVLSFAEGYAWSGREWPRRISFAPRPGSARAPGTAPPPGASAGGRPTPPRSTAAARGAGRPAFFFVERQNGLA